MFLGERESPDAQLTVSAMSAIMSVMAKTDRVTVCIRDDSLFSPAS